MHPEHAVAYAGTHDNDTLVGWLGTLPGGHRRRLDAALKAAGVAGDDPNWALIRLAFSSRARLAMIQAQDVLGLGSEARMNTPGRPTGNWLWKLEPGQLTAGHARRLRAATEEAGRLP
jgi:4-alpha-glucanotransferase